MTNFIMSFLTFLEVSSALLIIVVILMQRSRSGGGLGAIAGGATEEVFGSNAGNVLTKATIYLSIFFFACTLALAVLQGNVLRDRNVSVVEKADRSEGEKASVSAEPDDAAPPKITGTNEVTPPTEKKPTTPEK